MIIEAKVIAGAKENKIIEEESCFKIKVSQVAQDGKANEAVKELVVDYFKVKKRDVKIISGEKSNYKRIEIQWGQTPKGLTPYT